ncbi:uncharacterized protein LOC118734966 [Rhagoletis pomonella]|uniref:uncharacterized protein LOC118734966 n=1 Tax=Rhagoletis pomonella TaxID=28610 RepID=UPI001784762D|nr:uncharacterized protein LOC118734966 [Rhagoletis pomonella]
MTRANKRREAIREQSENPNITFLKRKSLWFRRQVNNFRAEIEEHSLLGADESSIIVKLEQLERMQVQFEEEQSQLEKEDNAEIESETRMEFLDSFIFVKAAVTKSLGSRSSTFAQSSTRRQSTMEEHSAVPSITVVPRSRLPPLQLPRFSGVITEWPDFWAMFSAVVDKETNLSSVEKFQHLRSCVSGIALDAIRSLKINAENYEKAGVAEGSANGLRELSDKIGSHLRALQTIATNDEVLNGILIHIVTTKSDVETQSKWEEHAPINELPSWDLMSKFLERRVRIMESVEKTTFRSGKQVNHKKNSIRKQSFVTASPAKGCTFCNGIEHFISTCPLFLNLSPSLRFKEAKRLQLCINCLRKGHIVKNCKSSNCKSCSGKHNTLLHLSSIALPVLEEAVASPETKTALIADSKQPVAFVSKEQAMLATAVVMLKNRHGNFVPCRVLLDSTSQLHCITSDMANRSQLSKSKSTTIISGIGASDILSKENVVLYMQASDGSYSKSLSAVIVPTITTLQPETNLSNVKWNIPANIQLADPSFFRPQKIDLLIGVSLFFELLCVGQICLKQGLPILQKTRLGWIVAGKVEVGSSKAVVCAATSSNYADTSLNDLVKSSVLRKT